MSEFYPSPFRETYLLNGLLPERDDTELLLNPVFKEVSQDQSTSNQDQIRRQMQDVTDECKVLASIIPARLEAKKS